MTPDTRNEIIERVVRRTVDGTANWNRSDGSSLGRGAVWRLEHGILSFDADTLTIQVGTLAGAVIDWGQRDERLTVVRDIVFPEVAREAQRAADELCRALIAELSDPPQPRRKLFTRPRRHGAPGVGPRFYL